MKQLCQWDTTNWRENAFRPLFTLVQPKFDNGIIECDLKFADCIRYSVPALSLRDILTQGKFSSWQKKTPPRQKRFLDAMEKSFPALCLHDKLDGKVHGPVELFSIQPRENFTNLSLQIDTNDEDEDFVAFNKQLQEDYLTASTLSPIYEGAIVLACDYRYGEPNDDTVYRSVITNIDFKQKTIDVAHLDYYSKDKVRIGNFRVAPDDSVACTRKPRIILVKFQMNMKDMRQHLKDFENEEQESYVTVAVSHVRDILYDGKCCCFLRFLKE